MIIDGQLRYGLCILATSVMDKPGHLQAHFYNEYIDDYSFENKLWQKRKIELLTKQEKTVLALTKQGITTKETAIRTGVKPQTVRNILNSVYRKLNFNSNIQAITYATHHHLIFVPEPDNRMKQEKIQAVKKERRTMTPEIRQRVQEKLNRGDSVNSIAKQENVGEWTIRYDINVTKKLSKKQ